MAPSPVSDRPTLLRRRAVLAPAGVLAAFAAIVGAALALGVVGGTSRAATPAVAATGKADGCTLVASAAGYPDRYITRALPYKIHPPLPVSGWHGATPLAFDVLFHSIFHGYVVITYRADLAPSGLEALRSWVGAHAAVRVVGTQTRESSSSLVDAAEWGWELSCDRVPSRAELSRFLARRGT
jgi:hypothetical protein